MEFIVSASFSVPPSVVYHAWLDPDLHGKMTGSGASGSPQIGKKFEAWDGYITSKTLELVKDQRMVQSWRTTDFGDADPDSLIEIDLRPTPAGTRLTLTHKNIPDGLPDFAQGWEDYYFEPMREFFGSD